MSETDDFFDSGLLGAVVVGVGHGDGVSGVGRAGALGPEVVQKRVDWGLLAGWGMAGMLMAGGWLQLARLCNQAMLTAMVLAGAGGWGLASYARWRDRQLRRRILAAMRWTRWLPFVPAAVLVGTFYASSVQTLNVNRWDDLPAYLPMAKRLGQTGICWILSACGRL